MTIDQLKCVLLGVLCGLVFSLNVAAGEIVDRLDTIRTITSEARDTLNCLQTPSDPACL